MLTDMGHTVFFYGAEGSSMPCTEFIQTHTLKDIRDAWGDGDNRFEIGYDWKNTQFRHDLNQAEKEEVTKKYYQNAIDEINKRKRNDDFLVITQGVYQRPIDQGVNLYLTIETGIGYRGSYAKFRAFESTYIQYFTYGSEHPRESINGNFYDRVVGNYYPTDEFPLWNAKKDYYLYMGRIIQRKGVLTALKACVAKDAKLVIAGQPSDEIDIKKLQQIENVEYVGYADTQKRAKLLGEATAVFTPSEYLEPFCGVHAEAMLCGTPVITTNFGAFTDTFPQGVCGYRCDTLDDFVWAMDAVKKLDPRRINKWALSKFSIEAVGLNYQKWFDDLYTVYESTISDKQGWHRIRETQPEWRDKLNAIQTAFY